MIRSFEELKYGQDYDWIKSYFDSQKIPFDNTFFAKENNSVSYEIDLYFFAEGKHLYTIKIDERKEFVSRKRELATRLLKEERYKQSVKIFEVMIEYCTLGIYKEDKEVFKSDLMAGYLNCSLCFWKMEKWYKMLKAAESAFELDNSSGKAAYRFVFALRKRQEFKEAIEFLDKHPTLVSEELTKIRAQVEADLKELHRREKAMYKDILS